MVLLQRLILLVWMGIVAVNFEQYTPYDLDYHNEPAAHLPRFESALGKGIFVVWRRWDGVHYLNLAQNGYLNGQLKSTVFPPLTPLCIRILDWVLPMGVDLAGLVFGALAFIFFLTMLYRVCETYYEIPDLAPTVVAVAAFLPFSYVFSAPMSESLYTGFVLGMFYAAGQKRWMLMAGMAFLAGLTRLQGLALAGIGLLLLLEADKARYGIIPQNWRGILKNGWALALVPLPFFGFLYYRHTLGLPNINTTYEQAYQIYSTHPLDGLLTNFRFIIEHTRYAIVTLDLMVFLLSLIFLGLMFWYPEHRRLPLLAYSAGFILIFVSKINQIDVDGERLVFTQSLARYSLVLFPQFILLAGLFNRASYPLRLALVLIAMVGLLAISAVHALGAGLA